MLHSDERSTRHFKRGRLFVLDPCGRWHARLCAYIIREHQRGRPLAEILTDRFVDAHASEAAITHLLGDPRLIRRLADDFRDPPRLESTRSAAGSERANAHVRNDADPGS